MVRWENHIKKDDRYKRWEGEAGFIYFIERVWVRGQRFVMESTEEYIGIWGLEAFR